MKKIFPVLLVVFMSSCTKEYTCECVAYKNYGFSDDELLSEDFDGKHSSYSEAKDWCDNQTNLYIYDFIEEGEDLFGYNVQCALN